MKRVLAFFCAFLALSAYAAPFNRTTGLTGTVNGNTGQVSYSTSVFNNLPGTPTPNLPVPTGNLPLTPPVGTPLTMHVPPGWGTVTNPSDGWPEFKTTTKAPVPGKPGKEVPLEVTAKPVKSALAKALVGMFKVWSGYNNLMNTIELLRELGVIPTPGADGGTTFTVGNWTSSGQFPHCVGYGTQTFTFRGSSPQDIAPQIMDKANAGSGFFCPQKYNTVVYSGCGVGSNSCSMTFSWNGNYSFSFVATKPADKPNASEVAESEVEKMITDKSSWPSTSNIGKAAAEAVRNGAEIEVNSPTITGPSSVPGGSTSSTTTNPDGSTSTTTNNSTVNITYGGNQYTTNVTNTSTTINNTTNNGNTVTTTTTTTTNEPTPQETDFCKLHPQSIVCESGSPSDVELPEVPKLYEPKYPDGMKGVWDQKKDQMHNTPLLQLAGQLMPQTGDSGTCPSWVIPLDFGFVDFGSGDVSPPCWLWPILKAIVIVCALLLARALVFGG
jgi:hypothetical protein